MKKLSFILALILSHAVLDTLTLMISPPKGRKAQASQNPMAARKQKKRVSPTQLETLLGGSEISGDAKISAQEAYQSWRRACEAWKKETQATHRDHDFLTLNCNSPDLTPASYGQKLYHSTGTYSVKIPIISRSAAALENDDEED